MESCFIPLTKIDGVDVIPSAFAFSWYHAYRVFAFSPSEKQACKAFGDNPAALPICLKLLATSAKLEPGLCHSCLLYTSDAADE